MGNYRSALHLAQKTLPENTLDRATGVIRPKAEQERSTRLVFLQQGDQRRNANLRSSECVYVYFECEVLFHDAFFELSALCQRR